VASRPPSLPCLTALRFVAASVVLLTHYAGPARDAFAGDGPAAALRQFLAHGYSAVSFFFVLSGLVLAYVHAGARPRWPSFILARVARLFPLHLATLALAAALAAIGVRSLHADLASLPMAALLLQAWTPSPAAIQVFNAPAWSISCELAFYAVFPAALRLVARPSLRGWRWWSALAATLAVGFALPALWFTLFGDEPQVSAAGWRLLYFWPPFRFHEFAAGMLLGVAAREPARLGLSLGPVAGHALLVAGVGGWVATALLAPAGYHPATMVAPWTPCAAAALLALTQGRTAISPLLDLPVSRALGDASFGVYLWHTPILFGWLAIGLPHWTVAGAAALTVAVALAGYRWLERPARAHILALAARPPFASLRGSRARTVR
jgi:peptidoglycan/LPS O-acetylase OafA/YrhL